MQIQFDQCGKKYWKVSLDNDLRGMPVSDAALWVCDLDFFENRQDWFQKIESAVRVNGSFWIEVENSEYFQKLIDKTTRETLPWTGSLMNGPGLRLKELEELIAETGWGITSVKPVEDERINNPGFNQWRYINGVDCKIELPEKLNEKANLFVKSWQVELKHGSSEDVWDQGDIEERLLSGKSQDLIPLIEGRLKKNPFDSDALNYRGIAYFYEKDAKKALDCFEKALQSKPGDMDLLRNIADAKDALRRE